MEISKLKEDLALEVQQLVIIDPAPGILEVVNQGQLEAFKERQSELVTFASTLRVDSAESFALAGQLVEASDFLTSIINERFEKDTEEANARHKALTGTRGDLRGPFTVLSQKFRNARAAWKASEDARIAREAAAARAAAEAEAKRQRDEQARLAKEAADRIAEEARVAAEEAAEAARVERERVEREAAEAAAAAAEIEDPMEALAAAAAAAEAARVAEEQAAEAARKAEEGQAELAREAELAQRLAEQAAAAPVIVARVAVEAPVVEDGVIWADNWVAEYDPTEALKALVAAGRIEFLMVNDKAITAAAKSQKSLASIPGVRVVNNKIEKRRKQ